MEEMQGESGVSEVVSILDSGEQEGYTVPDFVRQIKTAWKKLNNLPTSAEPDEDERE